MKKILALSLAAAALFGCSTEKVAICSCPAGADVVIGGEVVGQTPCEVRLDKDSTHQISIKKAGYKEVSYTLATTADLPEVKFGPLVDAGYYTELTPPGDNRSDGYLDAVIKADGMHKEGQIDKQEHSSMLGSIKDFYTTK